MPHTADQLLRSLDPLAHPQVAPTVAAFARSLSDRQLDELLADLDRRGPFERRLAALAAVAGRRTEWLTERLTDPDPVVRGYALRSVRLLPVPDAAIAAAYGGASAVVRRQLAKAVLAGRRTALAERLVVELRSTWGEAEAARLLPACSAGFVARLLPELAHAVSSLGVLTRRHPTVLLDYAEQQLPGRTPELRSHWWQYHADGLAVTVDTHPERVLDLLERYGPAWLPSDLQRQLGALIAVDPGRVLRWLLAPERSAQPLPCGCARSVLRRLAQAQPTEPAALAALGRRWFEQRPGEFRLLLRELPPSRRAAFFDAATEGLDTEGFTAPELLPREHRWARARAEAKRLSAAGRDWRTVLPVLAQLPVAEARPELLAATRRPEAGDRAFAWPLLIANAGRSGDPAETARLLALCERLRNEQDPVRAPALTALAELHPRLFGPADVDALDRVLTDALEARDASYRTRQAVTKLAVGVLREHATEAGSPLLAWALAALERITGQLGNVDLGALHRTLRRGQEHQVLAALRPWLDSASAVADHRLLFALTRSLGDRAHGMPELQQLLEQALQHSDDAAFGTAARLWLSDPRSRDARVERILALEPSAVVLPPVEEVLTTRRTDLLDPLLAGQPPHGRFVKPGTRLRLPDLRYAARWLPRQQAAAARLTARAAADTTQAVHARAAAIRAARGIPLLGRQLALEYLDSAEVVLAEAALAALAWADDPARELPVLLARADGDRARVAVYAASRAARYAAPGQLAEQLGGLLTGGKVTTRKEAVRLAAGYLPPERAVELLRLAYLAPGQHPDVQAAVIAAGAGLLEREEIWALFGAAATDSPQTGTALLRTRPWQLAEAHRARFARLVGEVCRTDQPDAAVPALGQLATWARFAPEAADVLPALVTDLTNRQTWQAAVRTLTALAGNDLPHPLGGAAPGSVLHRTVTGLLASLRAGEFEALADRDLPARQRLTALVDGLPRPDQPWIRTNLAALAGLLAEQPAHRVDVLLGLVDPAAGTLSAQLRELAEVCADRPALAASAAARLSTRLGRDRLPDAPEQVRPVAEQLAADGGSATGLLAVGLLVGLGPQLGWPAEWRAVLRTLRRHPAPDVRDAALDVLTAAE
ncbi:hypothetical protein ACFQ0T_33455 [Kitasatospora gansuensis]